MIHSTAIIDPKAKIGKNVQVGPYSVIGPNVVIGENTIIQSHVSITGNITIGEIQKSFHSPLLVLRLKILNIKAKKTAWILVKIISLENM